MKIDRLLEIIIILLNKGTITAKDLADRFQVSTRTIYRDIDVLSAAGVPVFTNKGNGGGISLLENYALNKTLISEHESESLLFALKTLQATQYPEIDKILDKIGAMFKSAGSTDWVYIDFSPWGSNPNEYNKFIDIKKAILECRVISFDYANSEGKKSNRSIEPMRLIFKGQAWYLWGYCRIHQDFRTFRISRIKNAIITNELFERKKLEAVKNVECDEKQEILVTLKLKFSQEVLHRLYDDFDYDTISKNDDGSYIVTVTYPEDEWVYGYIMSFGCHVEVLEPEHVREIIADRTRKVLQFYDKKFKYDIL
jgi:predicted DNA-binding transcriptional regulator YafY